MLATARRTSSLTPTSVPTTVAAAAVSPAPSLSRIKYGLFRRDETSPTRRSSRTRRLRYTLSKLPRLSLLLALPSRTQGWVFFLSKDQARRGRGRLLLNLFPETCRWPLLPVPPLCNVALLSDLNATTLVATAPLTPMDAAALLTFVVEASQLLLSRLLELRRLRLLHLTPLGVRRYRSSPCLKRR